METVLIFLVHNSIQRSYIIVSADHHRLNHLELEVGLSHACRSTICSLGCGWPDRALQIELSTVLILSGCWMMNAYDCSLIKAESIISLVS